MAYNALRGRQYNIRTASDMVFFQQTQDILSSVLVQLLIAHVRTVVIGTSGLVAVYITTP